MNNKKNNLIKLPLNSKIISLIKKFFILIEEKQIPYCVLRNYEEFWDRTGFDIDILIDKESLTDAMDILKIEAKANDLFISCLSKVNSEKIFISNFDSSNESRCWIYFDLQSSIDCYDRKYRFALNDLHLINYSINEATIVVLSEEWQFFFFLHKHFKENRNDINYDYLKNIYKENESKYFKIINQIFKKEIADSIHRNLLESNNKKEIKYLRDILFNPTSPQLFGDLKQKINHYIIKLMFSPLFLNQRLRAPVIVVSGPDGVGKTTLINELSKILLSFPINTDLVHHMYWKKKMKLNKIASQEVKSFKNIFKTVLRKIIPRPITHIINLCLGEYYYIKSLSKIFYNSYSNSSLVILDRYIIDRYAKMISIGKNDRSTKITKGVIPFLKKPLVQIYLLDDPHKIAKRKQELNEKQISLYQNILLEQNKGEVVWVNNRNPHEIALQIARITFDYLEDKKLFSLIGSWENKQMAIN